MVKSDYYGQIRVVLMQTWQIQEAKAKMSELIKRAQAQPQDITLHGKSVAVVISRETYNRVFQADMSLVEFMRCSPLYDADDVEFERDKSLTREVSI